MSAATSTSTMQHRFTALWDSVRGFARARFELRGAKMGARVRCYGRVHVDGAPGITIGSRVLFSGGIFATELSCSEGATLSIGSQSMFNYGVSIVATERVRIGQRCMFGSLVHVRDDDGRRKGAVTIGDDVWIAHGAIVEPGSTIGDGSVVAAGAVVCGHVPPRMLAIGNPAQCVPLETADSAVVQAQTSAQVVDPEVGPKSVRRRTSPPASEEPPAAGPVTLPSGAPESIAPASLPPQSLPAQSLGSPDDAPPSSSPHARAEVRSAIIDWLDQTRHFGEAEALIPNDAVSLRDGGLLDSLGLVQLVLMLEKKFDVAIDRELLARPGSQSMNAFLDLVTGPAETSETDETERVEPAATPLLHAVDPERAAQSQLATFAAWVTEKTGVPIADYKALHAFSTSELETFWSLFLTFGKIVFSGDPAPACTAKEVESARFFPNLRISWAENMLAAGDADAEAAIAIVAADETGAHVETSRRALRRKVRAVAAALEARGLREGDRVVAVVRNTTETVIACLAVTSLGATWSSVAPDMGPETALARFAQLDPAFLVFHRGASLNGARVDVPVAQIATGLPTLRALVALDAVAPDGTPDGTTVSAALPIVSIAELESEGAAAIATDSPAEWRRFPFDHPLFILFSSGTTGAPKCIVHGHGGTVLEHLKEHRLHGDLGPRDRLFFQTSTGWMMWNWTLSALGTFASIVLYDGSVSFPERDALLQVASRAEVTVFGTSPAYLQYLLDAGITSGPTLLGRVREMLSTGSVLYPHLHRWAKEGLRDVPLQSISGGTDILGCFVLGSPWTATFEGESSCIGLGLDVKSFGDGGALDAGRGELVCVRPFPSRPVGFVADPDGARFHGAYYAQHENAWTHGDLIDLGHEGRVRVLGRCDGVLNIRGIRMGPGEIYDVLANAVPEVAQAMAVDQEALSEPGGRRLLLFVVLKEGLTLDRPLTLRIKKELKLRGSPAHVPAVIVQVSELPTTFSGKRSEASLQDALSARVVRNLAALRNPQCIDRALDALKQAEAGAAS